MRTFTPDEPALGESFLWRGGGHTAEHEAGCDLTEELASALHGADLRELCPVVGVLVAGA